MGRIPRVPGRKVLRAIIRAGFELSHVNGSHHFLRGPGGRVVIVAVHQGRTVPPGTLNTVLRQAGLTRREFTDLLDE